MRGRWATVAMGVVLGPVMSGCLAHGGPAHSAASPAAARRELLAADAAYAARAAGLNAIEALALPLSDNAVFLARGPGLLRGPTEVRAALAQDSANAHSRWRWTLIRGDVSSDGRHGYTFGYTELVLPDGRVLPGKYHAYWVLGTDGAWRVAAYKRTPRPAGAVPAVAPAGFDVPTGVRAAGRQVDVKAELARLFAVDVAFSDAAQGGVAQAFATYAAEDGAQSGNQAEWAFGREQIFRTFEGDERKFSWSPEAGSVAGSGDLGFTAGFVRQGSTILGKYLTIWQKQQNGEWRYVVD